MFIILVAIMEKVVSEKTCTFNDENQKNSPYDFPLEKVVDFSPESSTFNCFFLFKLIQFIPFSFGDLFGFHSVYNLY